MNLVSSSATTILIIFIFIWPGCGVCVFMTTIWGLHYVFLGSLMLAVFIKHIVSTCKHIPATASLWLSHLSRCSLQHCASDRCSLNKHPSSTLALYTLTIQTFPHIPDKLTRFQGHPAVNREILIQLNTAIFSEILK